MFTGGKKSADQYNVSISHVYCDVIISEGTPLYFHRWLRSAYHSGQDPIIFTVFFFCFFKSRCKYFRFTCITHVCARPVSEKAYKSRSIPGLAQTWTVYSIVSSEVPSLEPLVYCCGPSPGEAYCKLSCLCAFCCVKSPTLLFAT